MRPEPHYQDDAVRLFAGDCLAVMPHLTEPVDLVIADLPYGTTPNQWDRPIDPKLLWSAYRSLVKPRGAVILFGSGIFSARTVLANEADFRYTLVWRKMAVSGHLNAKRQPLREHEDLIVFYRQQPTYNPQMVQTGRRSHSRGGRVDRTNRHYGEYVNTPVAEEQEGQYPRSILEFPRPKLPKGKGHPTQKPVDLLRWLIRTYSNPGDLVLDNVAGSGSTLVAARSEGRRAVGVEIDEDDNNYVGMAAARLASGSEEDRW